MRRAVLFVVCLFLSGCSQSVYSQYYTDLTTTWPASTTENLVFDEDGPEVVKSLNLETDIKALQRKGYIPIGYSYFNAAMMGEGGAKAHGKELGASLVLVSSTYTNTATGSVPLTLPNTTTTTSTSTGRIGSMPYSGSSVSTTTGSSTTYIPYRVDRYDQSAVYFKKAKKVAFGILFAEVPQEIRAALQSNMGVYVNTVIEDSPAYYGDILEGDVIVTFNEVPVYSPAQMSELIGSHIGQLVNVSVFRQGSIKVLPVQLAQ